MPADTLLSRLDGVRQTGPGRWLARCPAHDDRRPSLSIRETDDGTVLIHDFGGCEAVDVIAAVGLELADLFPDSDGHPGGHPRAHARPGNPPRIPAADRLAAIDREATVVAMIADSAAKGATITEAMRERLALAASRIGAARDG